MGRKHDKRNKLLAMGSWTSQLDMLTCAGSGPALELKQVEMRRGNQFQRFFFLEYGCVLSPRREEKRIGEKLLFHPPQV